MARIVVCKECGEEKPHCAKGLCRACYDHQHHETHQEKRREATRRWNEVHKEERRGYKRQYRADHKAELSEHGRQWYEAHRAERCDYNCQWRKANPDKNRKGTQRYRALKAGLPATLTEAQWQEILEEHGHACAYCGAAGVLLEQEHVIPVTRGGGYVKDNIVPACSPCNRRKGTKTAEEFMA